LEITQVKSARKEHTCQWCMEKIEKGSSYTNWHWYYEDSHTLAFHNECGKHVDNDWDVENMEKLWELLETKHKRGTNELL